MLRATQDICDSLQMFCVALKQVLLPSFSALQTFAKNRQNEADVGGTYYHQMKIQGLQQKFMDDQVEQSVVKMLERYPS